MKPVRERTALVAGAAIFVVSGVALQLMVNAEASLPRHSWWEAALLFLAATALTASGWNIRRYVRSLEGRKDGDSADGNVGSAGARTEIANVLPPAPETARRTLVLAQAAALGGAVLAGWYFAQIAVQIPRWNVTSVRNAVALLTVLGVEAVGVSIIGFMVQKWCTIPEGKR